MTDIFVAISDPKRREILELLAKEEQTLAQLAKTIKETPAATTTDPSEFSITISPESASFLTDELPTEIATICRSPPPVIS